MKTVDQTFLREVDKHVADNAVCCCHPEDYNKNKNINLLAPELFFLILAHPVYKMWIIQESNTLELWNKLHFEEKKTENIHHV